MLRKYTYIYLRKFSNLIGGTAKLPQILSQNVSDIMLKLSIHLQKVYDNSLYFLYPSGESLKPFVTQTILNNNIKFYI